MRRTERRCRFQNTDRNLKLIGSLGVGVVRLSVHADSWLSDCASGQIPSRTLIRFPANLANACRKQLLTRRFLLMPNFSIDTSMSRATSSSGLNVSTAFIFACIPGFNVLYAVCMTNVLPGQRNSNFPVLNLYYKCAINPMKYAQCNA